MSLNLYIDSEVCFDLSYDQLKRGLRARFCKCVCCVTVKRKRLGYIQTTCSPFFRRIYLTHYFLECTSGWNGFWKNYTEFGILIRGIKRLLSPHTVEIEQLIINRLKCVNMSVKDNSTGELQCSGILTYLWIHFCITRNERLWKNNIDLNINIMMCQYICCALPIKLIHFRYIG